ncbi:helicase associated domain-containing protein [Arthrobacter agilis]|uniref:helicase associated domain-containing protein n=1 Tax=Arthrobacter agilis TaxID=37921 RepID=UPI002366239D|nr:helicase associated domain-containing protein [Arthrobacter agilis]WDF32840.1 helicase associated domain-containing protein [Arthrobacter agilis]
MPTTSWDLRLHALTAFREAEGHEPSTRSVVPGEHRLALWLDEQRKAARSGRLAILRQDRLREAGFLASGDDGAAPRTGTAWLRVASVAEFLEEEGRLPSLASPTSAGEKRLALWMHAQLSGRGAETEPLRALRSILDAVAVGGLSHTV